ncbi:hypothetical protein BH24ACT15_BH24ACT15_21960 [soil metagenome]
MIQYLDLADFLLRAEAVLGIDAETLVPASRDHYLAMAASDQ